jgi:anti-sigma factor RsiW
MSTYRPEDLDELLGAFALDAVDDDERRLLDAYVAANPRARSELEQHREVATLLAFTGSAAPEGLWDRIAASLDEPAPAPGPELAKVLPMAPAAHRRRRWNGTALGAAAAGVAAAVTIGVLGAMVLERQRDLDDLRPQAVAGTVTAGFGQAMADPASVRVELVGEDGTLSAQAVVEPDGIGFLAAGGLPELADDRTYQLWGVVEGKVISLGVLGSRPGIETFTVDGDLTALVVTEEERGGVPVSEQPALLAGELS